MKELEYTTIKVEQMRPGYRYWDVGPGFEDSWTIKSVELRLCENEVDRGEGWYTPTLVIVTRNDGDVRVFELGEDIAIMGPYPSEAVSRPSKAALSAAAQSTTDASVGSPREV